MMICHSDIKIMIVFFFFFETCSQEALDHDIHVKEWALVYSPNNKELGKLMTETARLLELQSGAIAVNTSDQVEAVMFNRELVAGLEFDLPEVTI